MAATPAYLVPPATPPGTNTKLVTGNAKISSVDLDPTEIATFKRDLSRIATITSLERDLYELLMDDADALQAVAALAKGSIGTNPHFSGLLASGNEIGMSLIRPATVLSNNTVNNSANVAPVYNWVHTYTASGWTDVFGSAASPIDLSSTGIATFPVTNTQNRVMVAVIALLNTSPAPQLSEVKFSVDNVVYPVQPIAWLPSTDLFYAKLQGIFVITVNDHFYMRGNVQPSSTGGQDATQLFGLTFATGTYLTYE
ncbi:MAG: hypothetical protein IVW52_05250 [Acidimicrobiales bacterium]|nr:hypothetical protein [Acidimicrobiales bacterium]